MIAMIGPRTDHVVVLVIGLSLTMTPKPCRVNTIPKKATIRPSTMMAIRITSPYGFPMIYRWLVVKAARIGWQRLSEHRVDDLPLTDDVHFVFLGDHELAVDLRGADALRDWLRALFVRFPRLRFEPEDVIVQGGPWSTRVATRYNATQDGELVYRAVQFARITWGKLAEETIQPDTQLLVAALARQA